MTKVLLNRFKSTLANAALVISHCADHRDPLFTLWCGGSPQQNTFWVILTKTCFFSALHVKKKKKKEEAQLTALWWWLTRQRGTVCNTLLLSPGNNTSRTDENWPHHRNNWIIDKKVSKKQQKKHTPFSCSVMSNRHRCLKMTNKYSWTKLNKKLEQALRKNSCFFLFVFFYIHFLMSPWDLTSVILSSFVRLDLCARLLLESKWNHESLALHPRYTSGTACRISDHLMEGQTIFAPICWCSP